MFSTAWHQMMQAHYERRIAREGLLAALAPYRLEVRIPAQRESGDGAAGQ